MYFWRRKMNIFNKYNTPNRKIIVERLKRYLNMSKGYYKDFKLNHAGIFKELPGDATILTDYADQILLRTSIISSDIILHSIYIKYPELFEY